MTISVKTQKMLWGRAANRCAICHRELVLDATETDDESLIGDACHIVGEKKTGPRGDAPLNQEQRDKYANLILLCKVHHKQIDDQENTYTIEELQVLKENHEKWVRETLQEFDSKKQYDDEIYATYVDEWAVMSDLNNWRNWSSSLLGPIPRIHKEHFDRLNNLRRWILSRIWPERYEELEAAFINFRFVLDDLVTIFNKHAIPLHDGEVLITEKFYQLPDWDPPRYERLVRAYNFHVDLIHDLMLELTRAANFICDWVRHDILPSYRINEGAIIADSGPYNFMDFITHRSEYLGDDRVISPYPGLEKFKLIRKTREYHFGEGTNFEDPFYD